MFAATRQWSRALPSGPRPSGRYGHSLNILGSKIYIFGGQVEGYFMNDLSAFDLNQLQMPQNKWELLVPNSDNPGNYQGKIPPARTNHSVITYGDKMYLFGGTNGFQWFNDVWCYDAAINQWSQLDCIGYIPVPREGHAAAIVDDVMYIFGGRTEEGADLGDLAAFRITSRRWYTFQNMGPSPSPRSGHSMTSVGKTIVVVGGEPSSATAAVNDLALVYCLDTTKIRYPNDSQATANAQRGVQGTRRPSDTLTHPPVSTRAMPSRDGSAGSDPNRRLMDAPRDPTTGGSPRIGGVTGPQAAPPSAMNSAPSAPPQGNTKLPRAAAIPGPIGPPPQGQAPRPVVNTAVSRIRNESVERGDAQVSPVSSKTNSPILQQVQTIKENDSPTANGRRTPTTQLARSGSRQAESQAAEAARSKPPPRPVRSQGSVDSQTEPTIKTVANRPVSPPPPTRQTSNPISRRSSQRNSQTVVLLKELDSARNRNAWYASELELARKAGYIPSASMSPALDKSAETFDDDDKPLIEALIAMRTELANVQSSVDKQAVLAAKQIAEAERQRDAAIQEAVYAKAKLAAHGGSANSTPQLDREVDTEDRVGEMSKKLATALHTQRDLQNKLERMTAELDAEKKARKLADDTTNAAQKRMTELEAYKQQNSQEVERLRSELHIAQKEAREQSIKAAEAVGALELLKVEKDEFQNRFEEANASSKEHHETFGSLRAAISAAEETKSVLKQKLEEEKAHRSKVEDQLLKLKADHETCVAELDVASQRLREAEEVAERHANEAELHRQAVVTGLDRISARDANAPASQADGERIVALQSQLNAANALVRKYQQEADAASDKLRSAEERIAGLEAYQEQASREGVTIRRQLQAALRDTQSLQAANSDLKHKLANQELETNAMTVQHNTLKDLLAERGISPTSAARSRALASPREPSPQQQARLQHLEEQLASEVAAHEETRATMEVQAQEADAQYREKLAQLENDYLSAVQYVKGTEKMLKQLKEQLTRFKTENTQLKEQLVELEDKVQESSQNAKNVPDDWESQRDALQAKINSLEQELKTAASKGESQMQEMQQELEDARNEREDASRHAEQIDHLLSVNKKDLEKLQQENALLERRAQDAEQKVGLLLDQVETSVGSYRRRSKQPPSVNSEASTARPASAAGGPANGTGHSRQISLESASEYGGLGDARNSTALDNLANELETLRSHWEATNKNYRLSNTFDFDAPGTPTGERRKESVSSGGGLGLSESLADWRKRLGDDEPTTSK